MPVASLEIYQYSPADGTWESIPGFEGEIVTDFWKEIFNPDSVCWWAVGWKTGDVVYYAWQQENACSGMVMAPGVVGSLPGPPGPPAVLNPAGYWSPGPLTLTSDTPLNTPIDIPTNTDVASVLILRFTGQYFDGANGAGGPLDVVILDGTTTIQSFQVWDSDFWSQVTIYPVAADYTPNIIYRLTPNTASTPTVDDPVVEWSLVPASQLTVTA